MIQRHTHGKLTWIDLENPTLEEVRDITNEFKLNPLAAEELMGPSLRPKVDLYPNFIYLILHFPTWKHTHTGQTNQEVDFIIGKNFLITTRYDTIDPLHKFSKIFEVNSILDRSDMGNHAGFLFFYMIKKLYKAIDHELDYMNDQLKVIENHIFSGKEKEMVQSISATGRNLLNFKQALRAHKDILSSLEGAGEIFFGEDFRYHLKTISGEYFRVYTTILSLGDFLSELRDTNDSLLSSKQSDTSRALTVIASITIPLSIITSLLQIDAVSRPIVGLKYDFWIIVAILVGIGALTALFFNRKKWL